MGYDTAENIQFRMKHAKTWHDHWQAILDYAQIRPAIFIGGSNKALYNAVRYPIDVVYKTHAFSGTPSCKIFFADNEYCISIKSGAIASEISDLIDWEAAHLVEEFHKLRENLVTKLPISSAWVKYFLDSEGPTLEMAMRPVYLSNYFVFGIKTEDGFWAQAYIKGWPISEPALYPASSNVGLFVAASLPEQWFPGLPFTMDLLNDMLPSDHEHKSDIIKCSRVFPEDNLQLNSLGDFINMHS